MLYKILAVLSVTYSVIGIIYIEDILSFLLPFFMVNGNSPAIASLCIVLILPLPSLIIGFLVVMNYNTTKDNQEIKQTRSQNG